MNCLFVRSVRAFAVFAFLTSVGAATAACSAGADVPIGKSKDAIVSSPALQMGDECPPEKCGPDQWNFACGDPVTGAPVYPPANTRCVAGPPSGSGSGSGECRLDFACEPVLREGDECPPEKCGPDQRNEACVDLSGAVHHPPADARCVAGPQSGSGIGACRLDFDCNFASP